MMTRLQSNKRDRNAAHKVYVPNDARDNQYLIAQFKLTPALIEHVQPHYKEGVIGALGDFYKKLSQQIFMLCEKHGIEAVSFIANDKTPIVRFNMDFERIETDEKIMFFYHPQFYRGQTSFFSDAYMAKKIKVLFLATGDNIRVNAALFHQQVRDVITRLSEEFSPADVDIDVRDHQHITYDLFANNKSKQLSQSHKFRPIATRYQSQHVTFSESLDSQTFVVVNFPMDNHLRNIVPINDEQDAPYDDVYTEIERLFMLAMTKNQIGNAMMVANNKMPLVRHTMKEVGDTSATFQMINTNNEGLTIPSENLWDGQILCDVIKFVFIVPPSQCTDRGYGKYINQLTKVIEAMAQLCDVNPNAQQILIRVYQHLGYAFNDAKDLKVAL